MTTPLEARTVPDIVTKLPGPGPGRTSSSTTRGRARASRGPTRSSPCAASAARSRTSTATCSSTSPPASPSTRPATAIPTSSPRSSARPPSSSTSARATSTCRSTPQAAAELARIAPMSPARVFIGNSGAEAVEAGLKLARYATKRSNVVAFLGGFHGRTMGAVSLTASKAKYHAHFGPLLPGVYHVPFGNEGLEELERRVFKRLMPADEFAAVIVEPIQGEGGYVVPEDDFLRAAARAVRSPRDPADRRRGPVGRGPYRQDVGRPALGRRAGHPADGKGHRLGDAGRRDDREVGPDDLGSRRPRQHLRRQPGRPRGAARDRPAARERPDRQRRHPRPARSRTRSGRCSSATRRS